ncbi:MAG: ferritin [Bacteroidales bacterium]
MKLSKKVEEILNKQINAEFWSAYMYLSMSAYFQSISMNGFAHWMRLQFEEEKEHALKIYDYVYSRGGEVKLAAIDQVPTSWKSVAEVMNATYEHECKVTSMIYNCYEVAASEKDYASMNMLQWFVDEQVEEEENVQAILDKLALVGESKNSLYFLDREMGKRA